MWTIGVFELELGELDGCELGGSDGFDPIPFGVVLLLLSIVAVGV